MNGLKDASHLLDDGIFGIESAHLFKVAHGSLCRHGDDAVLFGEAVGLHGACEYLQQRGLSAAVPAHETYFVVLVDGQRNIAQHLIAVIEFIYIS